MLTFVEYPVMG